MQVGAISSSPISFSRRYYGSSPEDSFDEAMDNAKSEDGNPSRALRLAEVIQESRLDNEDRCDSDNDRKSPVGVVASIAGTGLTAFIATKIMINKGKNLLQNETISKITNGIQDSKIVKTVKGCIGSWASKIKEKILSIEPLKKPTEAISGIAKKIGSENGVAGASAIGVMIGGSQADTNDDGIADVSQKNVSWIKNVFGNIFKFFDDITYILG